jgi:hypothetical protein
MSLKVEGEGKDAPVLQLSAAPWRRTGGVDV